MRALGYYEAGILIQQGDRQRAAHGGMAMAYYQRRGSMNFHTHPECSKLPYNLKTHPLWTIRATKPKGIKCRECTAKETRAAKRSRVKTKRKR